jgi:hypothetical protein
MTSKNINITFGEDLVIHDKFPMVDNLVGTDINEKIVIYPKLVVYKNMLPKFKEHIDALKESYFPHNNNYYFRPWEDWYGLGDIMNLALDPLVEKKFSEDNEYLNRQIDLINALRNAFYKCTYDYINEWNFDLPNWVANGISICKYNETKHDDKYAMTYHTDFRPTEVEAPGKKFGLTCTVYINDDYDGGGLSFLHEESGDVIDYKPNAGDVIVFPSGVPYWHAVDRVDNGEKYFVRLFWSYFTNGSKEWISNQLKYGRDAWEKIETERMKKENQMGLHHKYLLEEGEKIERNATGFIPKRRIKIQ